MAGVPNIPPRLTNQQCVTILYLKRNLFSTNIKSQSETKLKDSNKINLKVMFFGTDGFALETLKRLHEREKLQIISNLEVCCISNSGSAVNKYAAKNGLKQHLYPPAIEPGQFDLGVVASFGKLISSSVISKFDRGMINVHGSMLPKLRGAAPVVYALKQGLTETGITIMKIKPKKFDTGEILAQERVSIPPDIFRKELTHKMAVVGGDLLCNVLENLDAYEASAIVQDNSEATFAPVIDKSIALLDFNQQSAYEVYNLWRSIEDLMKLRCRWKPSNKSIRIGLVHSPTLIQNIQFLSESSDTVLPGQAVWLKPGKSDSLLCIKCREGWIPVDKINYDNRKTMSAHNFGNGFMNKSANTIQKDFMFIKDETET